MTTSLNKFGFLGLGLLMAAGIAFFFLRKEQPRLYINEFMTNNSSCCSEAMTKENAFEDWIEIYNAGSVSVDIGGMYFSQDSLRPLAYRIPVKSPEITSIQPGGFLLIWADGNPDRGVLHLGFKLDQDGEFIGFYDTHGRTIDRLTFGKQNENISFGRSSDSGASWKEFLTPTPGTTNR
ncbi:MAG: lamin tail domain-containing protein [Bacteroidota bacterium]